LKVMTMTFAIPFDSLMTHFSIPFCQNTLFTEAENKVSALFEKVKNWITSQELGARPCRLLPDLQSLLSRPAALVEGVFWGGFLVMGAYFSFESCEKLYMRCTSGQGVHEQAERIGEVVKRAFVDLLSLCSSVVYLLRWADKAEVISLGCYLPFVNYLCYGLSIVIQGGELLSGGLDLWEERGELLCEQRQLQRELHHKKLFHAMMRVVASVSMLAWASLGIGALAGCAIPSIFASLFLTVHCVLAVSAWCYKAHIDSDAQRLGSIASSRA
jgi:hypothetical protein